MLNSGKCPPQFVFEIIAAQAMSRFLFESISAEDVTQAVAADFDELYDTDQLANDLMQAIERTLVYIESANISDLDLLLQSYIYYVANYETLQTKRNKKPLFGGLLKGRPREKLRAYQMAKSFSGYAFGMANGLAPLKPSDWKPNDEEEMRDVFRILYPSSEQDDD